MGIYSVNARSNTASNSFYNTGIQLNFGDLLKIKVEPGQRWVNRFNQSVDANGIGENGNNKEVTFTRLGNYNFPEGSLVCSWYTWHGQNPNLTPQMPIPSRQFFAVFPVGTYLEMPITQKFPGFLYLAYWGNQGSGEIKVDITVSRIEQRYDPQKYRDYTPVNTNAYSNSTVNGFATPYNCRLSETNISVDVGDIITVCTDVLTYWDIAGGGWTCDGNGRNKVNSTPSPWEHYSINGYNSTDGSLAGTLDLNPVLNQGPNGTVTFFNVGTYLKMTALQTGKLSLAMWDADYGNNSGSLTSYVKVEKYQATPPGNFLIKNKSNNLVLTLDKNEPVQGKSVALYQNYSLPEQQWTINGQGVIQSKFNSFALDKRADNIVIVNPPNSTPTQQWIITEQGVIKIKGNDLVLGIFDDRNYTSYPLGYLVMPNNNDPRQQWELIKV